jgi:hypothetical protein
MIENVSHIVSDFTRVEIASGLVCPSCGQPFSPHSMIMRGDSIRLRCGGCHVDALRCEPSSEDDA